jgi:dihydroneopterin aldolase
MATVFIKGLRTDAYIGIHPWEQQAKQPLVFDVEMAADISRASHSDNIADALDYQGVAERIVALTSARRWQLVESLAVHIVEQLQQEFAIKWLKLTLNKPQALANADSVGVCLESGVKN